MLFPLVCIPWVTSQFSRGNNQLSCSIWVLLSPHKLTAFWRDLCCFPLDRRSRKRLFATKESRNAPVLALVGAPLTNATGRYHHSVQVKLPCDATKGIMSGEMLSYWRIVSHRTFLPYAWSLLVRRDLIWLAQPGLVNPLQADLQVTTSDLQEPYSSLKSDSGKIWPSRC